MMELWRDGLHTRSFFRVFALSLSCGNSPASVLGELADAKVAAIEAVVVVLAVVVVDKGGKVVALTQVFRQVFAEGFGGLQGDVELGR